MSARYYCNLHCPLHKHCFICKCNRPVNPDTIFLVKCPAKKCDVAVWAREALEKNKFK